jgi:two-component system CheB/CheR fusion protein
LSVSIGSGLPVSFLADEARLRQILFNLVGNAVKFTDRGLVSLDISPASVHFDTGFRVLLTVTDTGIGISDAQLGTIFEPFSQVEGVYVRRFGGAGLGLSIVRRLVALMNGEIAVESEVDRGTTIFVSLPLKRLDLATSESAPRECMEPGMTRLRLLLAEDDVVSAMSFTRMLEKAGHQVDVAEDGKQALALVAREDYACILMDVQMPVMDGVEATRVIRTDPAFAAKAGIPIIAMTAYAMAGDREKLLAAGMDDYVSKPVDIAALERAITRVLAARSGKN